MGRPDGAFCGGCVLQNIGNGFARTDGKGTLGVLAVAEALGADEASAGRPLVGRAGQLFNRMVSRTTDPLTGKPFERDDFLLANVINCQPPDNRLRDDRGNPLWYTEPAIAKCSPYLRETIEKFRPKVILAMGNTPLQWLTGHSGISGWRGYVVPTPHGLVVPTYHPSFIQRGNMRLAKVFMHDLRKAVHVARHGHTIAPVDYLIRPTPQEAERWLEGYLRALQKDPTLTLAFDIETPYSSQLDEDQAAEEDDSYIIERASLSYGERTGITMPWMPPFTNISRRALLTDGPKTVWNEAFDVPRLIHNECPIGGRIYDAMWAWHLAQPEWPYGLKYAATFYTDIPQWKHMSGSAPEYYSVVDADALLRCFNGVKRDLHRTHQWNTYERHVVDLSAVLRRMSRRGVLVSLEKRAQERAKFKARYDTLVGELTSMVPREILPRHPKGGYKKTEEQLRKVGLWQEGRMYVVGAIAVPEPKPAKAKKPRVSKGASASTTLMEGPTSAEGVKDSATPVKKRIRKSGKNTSPSPPSSPLPSDSSEGSSVATSEKNAPSVEGSPSPSSTSGS